MSRFILIDFGASRVKYACFDARSKKFFNEGDTASPRPVRTAGLVWEESPAALRSAFLSACRKAAVGLERPPRGVLVCSQTHGFIALDEKKRPLSNYISWKDERSLSALKKESAYEYLGRSIGAAYRQITGMKMRPCFPAFNFAALARTQKLPRKCRIASLPEWLAMGCDCDAGLVHETVFAGLGFYDLDRRRVSPLIYDAVSDYCGAKPVFGWPVAEMAPCATLRIMGADVPLYVGVGDHQSAVLGALGAKINALSVNVGTGSQVSCPGFPSALAENRPYLGNRVMATVTHLPAGRALEEFLGFFGTKQQ
ncbi:MAG TPA: FGGY family carbohydrate kinase, partial [Elusimicrobiales bacterium]|nr:FGGY family carbohydrate kinase [Elusimicrobiales bacterium]